MNRSRGVSYRLFAFLMFPLACFSQSRGVPDLRGSLRGRVEIAGGRGTASQLRVELRLVGENWKATAITNREGEFSVEGLTSGTYFVTVGAPGCEPFEETMQIDGGTPPLLLRLRRSQSQANSSAATVSARELRIPDKARKAFSKGNHLLENNDSAASIVKFQRAIKAFPAFYEAYYRVGVAELSLQDAAAAEAAFRKSIELAEGHYAPAQTGLSLALYMEKQFVQAEAAARAGLQLDPDDSTGHYALASALLAMHRLTDAEASALQVILRRPAFAAAYLLLAQIHLHQNNAAAVVADLDSYVKLDPDSPRSAKVKAIRAETQNALVHQTAGSPFATANP